MPDSFQAAARRGLLAARGATCAVYGQPKYTLPQQQAAMRILARYARLIYCGITYTYQLTDILDFTRVTDIAGLRSLPVARAAVNNSWTSALCRNMTSARPRLVQCPWSVRLYYMCQFTITG